MGGLTTILMILWVAVPTPSVLLTNMVSGGSSELPVDLRSPPSGYPRRIAFGWDPSGAVDKQSPQIVRENQQAAARLKGSQTPGPIALGQAETRPQAESPASRTCGKPPCQQGANRIGPGKQASDVLPVGAGTLYDYDPGPPYTAASGAASTTPPQAGDGRTAVGSSHSEMCNRDAYGAPAMNTAQVDGPIRLGPVSTTFTTTLTLATTTTTTTTTMGAQYSTTGAPRCNDVELERHTNSNSNLLLDFKSWFCSHTTDNHFCRGNPMRKFFGQLGLEAQPDATLDGQAYTLENPLQGSKWPMVWPTLGTQDCNTGPWGCILYATTTAVVTLVTVSICMCKPTNQPEQKPEYNTTGTQTAGILWVSFTPPLEDPRQPGWVRCMARYLELLMEVARGHLTALEVSWTREAALEMMERSKLTDHLSDLVQFEMDQNEWDRHCPDCRMLALFEDARQICLHCCPQEWMATASAWYPAKSLGWALDHFSCGLISLAKLIALPMNRQVALYQLYLAHHWQSSIERRINACSIDGTGCSDSHTCCLPTQARHKELESNADLPGTVDFHNSQQTHHAEPATGFHGTAGSNTIHPIRTCQTKHCHILCRNEGDGNPEHAEQSMRGQPNDSQCYGTLPFMDN